MAKVTLATFLDLFLKEMDEIGHASRHTLKAYRKDLSQAFSDIEGEAFPSEESLLRKAKEAQIKWGSLELSSRQRKAATIKAFFDWLYQQKYISSPLNEQVEAPKVPRKIPHFLSFDEVIVLFRFIENLDEAIPQKKHYLALVSLLYGGGLRVSEACHLTWKGIRLSSNDICILGKGQKERWVALPRKVIEAINQLPRMGDFIWGIRPLNERQAYGWIRMLGQKACLKAPLHPHALRHSYATHLVSAGINLRTLQELMGHSSLTSTEKYLHLSLDQLARTIDTHHPLGFTGSAARRVQK
jgi:integrase/recombinase XerC/integrase/recombinase XerD